MINRLLRSLRKNLRASIRDNRGAIATQFAILAVPLVLAAGVAVDLSRVSNVKGQIQDIADAAALAGAYQFTSPDTSATSAAQQAAARYISTMAPNLPDHPSVTMMGPVTSGNGSCNLTAPAATGGQVVAQVCATVPGSPSYIGMVQVAISYGVKTTLVAMVTPSIGASDMSTAQGGVARKVTVSVSNFNTSASDLDEIYYYGAPTDTGGNLIVGRTLYEYDPTNDIKNNVWANSSTPILSNKKGFTNLSSIGLQVPYGSRPAFALYNTTGGVSAYSANCYSQKQGQLKEYFSTRTYVPANATNTTQYYDYNAASFKSQPNTTTTGSGKNKITTTNLMCSNSKSTPAASVTDSGGTDTYTQLINCASNCTSQTWSAGNYLYNWGSSRNPLQFGNLNRDSTGMPTGGTSDGAMVTDCAQGNMTYNWDDNGGTGDDNDFNDIVFTVNCQTTTVLNTSVRLVK